MKIKTTIERTIHHEVKITAKDLLKFFRENGAPEIPEDAFLTAEVEDWEEGNTSVVDLNISWETHERETK